MFFQTLKKKYFPIIKDFLQLYEKYCVLLSHKIFIQPEKTIILSSTQNITNSSQILGLIFINNTLLHCLPFVFLSKNNDLIKEFIIQFSSIIKDKNIYCVNGEQESSLLITKLLIKSGLKIDLLNNYDLMQLDYSLFKKAKLPVIPEKAKIIRCASSLPKSFQEALYNLQKQYEIEEVLPPSIKFSPLACKTKLNNQLKNQYILALKLKDNTLASKAQTNAIGIKYVQLGGIFTLPQHRKNGYSYLLLHTIIKKILKAKKIPVLFVKKKNLPAKNLYNSIGFVKITNYIISYFVYNK